MDGFDRETGEMLNPIEPRGAMPAEIAKAIVEVCKKVKTLGTDERNEHAKYAYVSVDKFIETIGPLMAAAGLVLTQDEIAADVRQQGDKAWLFVRYAFGLSHTSGAGWGPVYRSVALQALGPQSFGAAESYMLKRFLRGLFMVPTGEKDADDLPQDGLPGRPGGATAQEARRGTSRTPNRPQAAPAPSGEQEVAREEYTRLLADIDAAVLPGLDEIEGGLLWSNLYSRLRGLPGDIAEASMELLRNRIAKRRTQLLAATAGPELPADMEPRNYGARHEL